MPYWPFCTPSGTPKLRSVTAAQLPAICRIWFQPLSQPSPWRMVSKVRWVVPEREVAEVDRLHQVDPLLGRRQLVRLQVAGVPHQAVAGKRLAAVQALGVVDRI